MATTIGVFKSTVNAEKAIRGLQEMGVGGENISYIFTDHSGNIKSENIVGETASTTGEKVVTGATTGGIIGVLAGLAVANGILPGLGTLFVAGPLAAALGFGGAAATTIAGAVTGAAAGGIIGALTSLGASEQEAAMYENRIRSGDILVTATTTEPEQARIILQQNGADEIREYK